MALSKERTTKNSHMGLIQACSFYGNGYEGTAVHDPRPYSMGLLDEGEGSETKGGALKHFSMIRLPSLSNPCNVNGIMFGDSNSTPEDAHYVINFKSAYDHTIHSRGSLLCFEQGEHVSHNFSPKMGQNDDYPILEGVMDDTHHHWNQLNPNYGSDSCLSEDLNCLETSSSYGSMNNIIKDNQLGEEGLGWLYSGGVAATESLQESRSSEGNFHKRPHMDGETQTTKKRCGGATRKPKPKSIPAKDPQSIAAKNRRERISERLKVLQDLVPNGAKVDLVTMLEKAISYVKFLQLQVKVLATDEFWPMQGGKAPEVAQVKEAIDAILSSHRN